MKPKKWKENNKTAMKTTKSFTLLWLMMAALLAVGCNGKKAQQTEVADIEDPAVEDSTVYGVCGSNTAMSTLELIVGKGDTLRYMLDGEDTTSQVLGGMFSGDHLAVVGYKDANGELHANKVINLTSLLGKWYSISRSFEIQEGGTVTSTMQEPKPYTEWSICNGKLVLSADTFDIYALGADSLYLENAEGIYGYKRRDYQQDTRGLVP